MAKLRVAAVLAFALAISLPASAGNILSVTGIGSVTPSPSCPPPPSPPFDCLLTANGTAADASASFGPWAFTSPFMLFSANPVSATEFRNGGTFYYDDMSPANDDFFGTFTGIFNLVTFTAAHTYLITGGTGAFAGAIGVGTGTIQVNPLNLQYVDSTEFVIPLPSTLALLALGVAVLSARARHRDSAARGLGSALPKDKIARRD